LGITRGAFFGGGTRDIGFAGFAVTFAVNLGLAFDVVAFFALSTGSCWVNFLTGTAAFGAGFITGFATGLAAGLTAGFFDVFEGIAGLRMTKIDPQSESVQQVQHKRNNGFFHLTASKTQKYGMERARTSHGVQGVWANIWCAVLAVRWPALVEEYFRCAEGRCRRCCCRACCVYTGLYPIACFLGAKIWFF
jgi:hypothetical protein